MSGGSFNYLFAKEPQELLNCPDMVDRMAERLADLGYAEDVASETKEVLNIILKAIHDLEQHQNLMVNIWYAMEWWQSNDWNEEDFKEALERYRKFKLEDSKSD